MTDDAGDAPTLRWQAALPLALATTVAIGFTRFSYGMLLPPMRADLGWSYTLAGGMNTANAIGYLLGALSTPWLLRRTGAATTVLVGMLCGALFTVVSAFVTDGTVLAVQRLVAGIASAWALVAGSLLVARVGILHPHRASLLLGVYYSGAGLGVILSASGVPLALVLGQALGWTHPWQLAWLLLGVGCVAATVVVAPLAWRVPVPAPVSHAAARAPLRALLPGLSSYFLYGIGYIGYMTFVIAWLREQGVPQPLIVAFYTLLGVAIIASSRVWAGLLERSKGGGAMTFLNLLLAGATALPALLPAAAMHSAAGLAAVFTSGILFGGVFLAIVASTTAMVRHNVPQPAWSSGIGAFTTVFAVGQIAGPAVVGAIADGPGGLRQGLLLSAALLCGAALLASRQRPLMP